MFDDPLQIRFSQTRVTIPRDRPEKPLVILCKDLIGAKLSKGLNAEPVLRIFHRSGTQDIPLSYLSRADVTEVVKVFMDKAELNAAADELERRDSEVEASLSSIRKYRYGVSITMLWLGIAFFGFGSILAFREAASGDRKALLIALLGLGFVIVAVLGLFLSRKPRYFVFDEHRASIPYSIIPNRTVVIDYKDLITVQKTTVSQAPMLRVVHRGGRTDIPYHVLSHIDVDTLYNKFLSRIDTDDKSSSSSPPLPALPDA